MCLAQPSVDHRGSESPLVHSQAVAGADRWRVFGGALQQVPGKCTSLTSLYVAKYNKLTGESIKAVAVSCASLASLNTLCCNFTDSRSRQSRSAALWVLTELNVE